MTENFNNGLSDKQQILRKSLTRDAKKNSNGTAGANQHLLDPN